MFFGELVGKIGILFIEMGESGVKLLVFLFENRFFVYEFELGVLEGGELLGEGFGFFPERIDLITK